MMLIDTWSPSLTPDTNGLDYFVTGHRSYVQDHRQDVPVPNTDAGAAPNVGRYRHPGPLHADAVLQQLAGRGCPFTIPVPRGDPAGGHRASVPQGLHPRPGDQHHPLPLHLLAAQLQWWALQLDSVWL